MPPSERTLNPRKRPRLPPTHTSTSRPLPHPAIPSPFTSSTCPKTLYITPTTPLLPTTHRITRLLSQIQQRSNQSASSRPRSKKHAPGLTAHGHLRPRDVEGAIAEAVENGRGKEVKEEVYLKASGKAIPRALEIGCFFQGEGRGCGVRVKIGGVRAVDDVLLKKHGEEGRMDVDIEGGEDGDEEEDEIAETRIRTVSTVTVAIWSL
ncbi:Rpp20 subunit of nuclear RNase MRP and P-domain-containing protein [Dendryphion nanum]|uniref:Rpp20 subunit of nuclear RNase MRP and P-domain-containing protein n=1 Tax=Dendryphion nanum TaxID=256645 RepID=A0A9P9DJ89_9PLEO|nr:Rpp20 subunit of nuclear RNase MRP and P-domain-containing protein [Dendryphion nanum]